MSLINKRVLLILKIIQIIHFLSEDGYLKKLSSDYGEQCLGNLL